MGNVTLRQASVILETALAKGRDQGFLPLTVAVLDSGGHLLAFKGFTFDSFRHCSRTSQWPPLDGPIRRSRP